jgi:hypothetical protein
VDLVDSRGNRLPFRHPLLFIKTADAFIYGSLTDLIFMDKLFNLKPLNQAKNVFS